ncbi:hypothetical protein GCM10011609_29400 [Lentzea pudingi]|uniref:Uncharacterized protein n=1 Tax=Lentzea pudingi TaxID=1789439 RepID=A0ABQ2HUM6_9PSEU|nr:hypothetical protein [Lentzea pudingi]GGM90506.1 hypothetical protein GCM10011609_29400 [Lentzea pudingi]
MSVELQVRTATLAEMIGRGLSARLRLFCPPPVGNVHIDHIDVSGMPARCVQVGAAVHLRLGLDVYLVSRDEVLAGGVPPGSRTPADHAVLVLEIAVEGGELAVRCVGLETALPVDRLVARIGVVLLFDLGAALAALGTGTWGHARVETVEDVVAVRFDPHGPATRRVGDEDWCLFVDDASMGDLASRGIADALHARLTGPAVVPHWRPRHGRPNLDIDYSGKVDVPDPFTASVSGTLWCGLSFTTPPFDVLRTSVVYSVHVDLGPLAPGAVESAVEDGIAAALDPAALGGMRTGPTSFTLDRPLPRLGTPDGVRFWYGSLTATEAGMTIAGSVFLGAPARTDTLRVSNSGFGGPPELMVFCSQGATPDTGFVPPGPDAHAVARVLLGNCGRFGDVEFLTPGIAPYVTAPVPGAKEETCQLTVNLGPEAVFTEPIRMIVRTARGVRLIDLGVPSRPGPPGDDDVPGAVPELIYVDDCLHEQAPPQTLQDWQAWWEEQQQMVWGPGDWDTFVQGAQGFTTQLVTVGGLDGGEIVRLTTPTHRIEVTADGEGRAVLPAIVRADARGRATIQRLNRAPLTRLVESREARVFLRTAGPGQGLAPAGQAAPQVDLPGLAATYNVPGFTDAPVAIAEMTDGERLVVDLRGAAPRVAGTFAGPIGHVDLTTGRAVTTNGQEFSIVP